MNLNGKQRKALRVALGRAYSRYDDFQRFLKDECDFDLNTVTDARNGMESARDEAIQAALSNGWIELLLERCEAHTNSDLADTATLLRMQLAESRPISYNKVAQDSLSFLRAIRKRLGVEEEQEVAQDSIQPKLARLDTSAAQTISVLKAPATEGHSLLRRWTRAARRTAIVVSGGVAGILLFGTSPSQPWLFVVWLIYATLTIWGHWFLVRKVIVASLIWTCCLFVGGIAGTSYFQPTEDQWILLLMVVIPFYVLYFVQLAPFYFFVTRVKKSEKAWAWAPPAASVLATVKKGLWDRKFKGRHE